MLNLFISPEAERDLEIIYQYTFYTWGQDQADKYQDDLFEAMNQILLNGKIGIRYPHADLDYRKFSTNKHLLFYKVVQSNCIIVRVLHERMNLSFELEP